jgi:amino acid permease
MDDIIITIVLRVASVVILAFVAVFFIMGFWRFLDWCARSRTMTAITGAMWAFWKKVIPIKDHDTH